MIYRNPLIIISFILLFFYSVGFSMQLVYGHTEIKVGNYTLKPGIVSEKPFRIAENDKEVPIVADLISGEKVEILEREMRKCPSCIGAGFAFSDHCKDCREKGRVAFFLVKIINRSKKGRINGKPKRARVAGS